MERVTIFKNFNIPVEDVTLSSIISKIKTGTYHDSINAILMAKGMFRAGRITLHHEGGEGHMVLLLKGGGTPKVELSIGGDAPYAKMSVRLQCHIECGEEDMGIQYLTVGNICYRSRVGISRMKGYEDWHLKDVDREPFDKWFSGESLSQHLFWNMNIDAESIKYFTWPTREFLLYTTIAWGVIYFICQTGKNFISNVFF